MADNVAITPGVGATIATDDVGAVHFQKVKLDVGGDGVSVPATGDAANGLDVDVTRVQGNVTVIQGTATNLKVDASGVPVPVTDNAGSLTVDTGQLPAALTGSGNLKASISETITVPVSDAAGSLTVDSAQLPAALVGGRLDVNIGAAPAAVPVTDNAGSLTVDDGATTLSVDDGGGALTVDGAVTATQGTAAAVAGSWPVKVSDGTDTVGISTVGGAKALKVDVVQATGDANKQDKTGFAEGTDKAGVVAGVFNDTPGADPAEDQAAAVRITAKRAVHVNLRVAAGTEIGTAGAPVRTDPTGSTTQPVSDAGGSLTVDMLATTNAGATVKTADYDTTGATDTVTMFGLALPSAAGAVAGGTATNPIRVDPTATTTQPVSGTVTARLNDGAGAVYSETNPLPVLPSHFAKTPVRSRNTFATAETAIAIWTPAAGKKFVIESIIVSSLAAGAGSVKIFDNTDADANTILHIELANNQTMQFLFPNGHPSSTANNVLRYTTGAGSDGYITVFGYEV